MTYERGQTFYFIIGWLMFGRYIVVLMAEINDLNDVTAEDNKRVTFDARNQYYRLWVYHIGKIRTAMEFNDHLGWRTWLRGLHNLVYPMLPEDKNKLIDEEFIKVNKLFMVLNNVPSTRDTNFRDYRQHVLSELEEAMHNTERLIGSGMRDQNMLLPISTGADDFGDLEAESG